MKEFFCVATIMLGSLAACSPGADTRLDAHDTPMRAEFLKHCKARPEYTSLKRAGTLETYCACVFDKTMNSLPEDAWVVAGFYLYGETSEGYMDRHPFDVQDAAEHMGTAAQAIGNAVKSCPS